MKPICLPPVQADQSGTLIVAGWGRTETGSSSNVLLETSVTEFDRNRCKRFRKNIISSQFCAGSTDKGACRGDSGGPLMKMCHGKRIVVGIVSYGNSMCLDLRNTVYTKVASFLDWIARNTKDAIYCRS